MNKKKESRIKQHSKFFMDQMCEVSKFTIETQADSFNAIDTKGQTYISIIALYIAILLGIYAITVPNLGYDASVFMKVILSVILVLLLANTVLFFLAIKTKPFKAGVSPRGLNNLKDASEYEIRQEIFSNLYWSADENRKVLICKSWFIVSGEILLIMNLVLTIILSILFVCLI